MDGIDKNGLAIFFLVFGIFNFIADLMFIAIMVGVFRALRKLYLNSRGETYKSKEQTRVTCLTISLATLLILNTTLHSIGRTVAIYFD